MVAKLGGHRQLGAGLLLALAGGTSACSTTSETLTETPPGAKVVEASADTLIREYYSGIGTRQRLVIPGAAMWKTFWTQVYAGLTPQPAVPAVYWDFEMVVAATMGTRASGGYSIHVDAISEIGDHLFVVIREVSPGASCGVTGALTAPVVAVRVPRHSGVSFIEKTETQNCGK